MQFNRRLRRLALLLGGLLLLPAALQAQTTVRSLPDTPPLSPRAEAYQQVGLTDVRIDYSSPAVRERVIWGGLVPHGELWRAGANAPTRLSVSDDFSFGGTPVSAGEYSLFILPEETSWTFILDPDPERRGYGAHDPERAVARAEVTPEAGPERERMLFLFDDTTDERTVLTLEWAGLQAGVPIEVDTAGLVSQAIEANLSDIWRPHFNAARYTLESGGDLDQAAEWMAQSIALEETFWNHWFMARIQAGLENYAAAREHVARAQELGAGQGVWEQFFLPQAVDALATWPE